jgi:hypothetical protein
MFSKRIPMEKAASSPETKFYSFIHSLISKRVPNEETSLEKWGKYLVTVHGSHNMDERPTYNEVRPGSQRGSFTTLFSLPKCHAAFSTIPYTLAWVDQSTVNQAVS